MAHKDKKTKQNNIYTEVTVLNIQIIAVCHHTLQQVKCLLHQSQHRTWTIVFVQQKKTIGHQTLFSGIPEGFSSCVASMSSSSGFFLFAHVEGIR